MKNLKTLFSDTILDFQDEITLKKILFEIGLTTLISIMSALLIFKLLVSPLSLIVESTILIKGLNAGVILGILSNLTITVKDLCNRNKFNQESKKEINNILLELKSKGLNYTKKDIKNAKVVEVTNKKVNMKYNGSITKGRKVVNYIILEDKKKLTIIKEIIKDIKKSKDLIIDSAILEKEDLIKEGLKDKDGFLTEKGKTLILNKK